MKNSTENLKLILIDGEQLAQAFSIPKAWYDFPEDFSKCAWLKNIYEAIGKGVTV